MMKRMKKVLALLMTAVVTLSMAGCGGGDSKKANNSNGGKEVQISYWNSGLGTDYLDAMIKAFNEKQSDWYVTYTATASQDAVQAAFGEKDIDKIDLYMGSKTYQIEDLEPLDDVLESTADGDSKTLKEKFNANYLDYEKAADGHYYSLTWGGGNIGIVYNKKLFEKAGITETPRTTAEMVSACDKLYEAGITPWTHFNAGSVSGGYWTYVQQLWQAQYDGIDYFINNFYGCKDAQGNSPSKEVFTTKDGRYYALKELAKFITPEYVQAGSNSQDHITMQTKFLNQDIGMVVNGSWMANEMESTADIDGFGVMKAPVISGVTEKLTTVNSDMELRKLVSAIDAVTEGKEDISQYQSGNGYTVNGKTISAEDWDYVQKARNSVATNNPSQTFFIPKYSTEKEGAKEFLKFYFSDEGYKIFTEQLHIGLPINLSEGTIDTSEWNEFERVMFDMTKNVSYYVSGSSLSKHAIFTAGGADAYANYMFIEKYCASNPSDRQTADEAWDSIMQRVEDKYDDWLSNIK